METVTLPRIVIAGTNSGCGKTSIASGLMAALTERGLRVQPFKTGPDFIDPTHHSVTCGRTSRNLDPFMMGESGVLGTFASASAGADIAVIEGAMGLFDGINGTDFSSTAHVARLLQAPVLLVVDARAAARSVHAVVCGFQTFDSRIRIAGILFNRIASVKHREMIATEEFVPALGWIPRQQGPEVRSRHLGLVMAHESDGMKSYGPVVRESCDLDRILDVARSAPPLAVPPAGKTPGGDERVVIGVARDNAFCFYYQDNLDRLARAGAEIRFFSPMEDTLPEVDALYLGGGYPELYAQNLEDSRCRHAIHDLADKGMPVYGECGGLMYLCGSVSIDREYRMAGVLPARVEMTKKIQALGYVKGNFTGRQGGWAGSASIRGHEFHYSRAECDPDARFAIRLTQGKGIQGGNDGLTEQNALGAYTHAYFSDAFCRRFVAAAAAFRRNR
ncbi:cobyrinate a,c-diamide synthase [Methanoregula sp.]|uniref:cobyrinate a,c-diamide synthase n=1 Tax=Methanoregula sp. TaxID=2052170 RepID=UPI0023718583|nr:cobyrinate a,c-diamide synthase [Methanoregula sp.]MDD1687313.1 cobyrinate a,c-diamide synthase [Methanoregula sp.]